MPRDVDDSVLADNLLLAMPRPPPLAFAPEKRQGAQKAAYAVFFAMLRHSCESGYFLKNPSPFLGYMGI